jgi:uncharacterized membrane protein YjgN (DUF898 family)
LVVDLGNCIYREWVPMGALVKGLVVFFSIIVVLGSLLVALSIPDIQDIFGIAFGVSILAFILFLFWNYRGIKIQLSNTELNVRYGFFNKKSIQLKDIVSCDTVKASFGRYAGIGVRYGFDGSQAYTTSFGDAVKIIPSKGRVFVFSSHDPQKICNIINSTKSAV